MADKDNDVQRILSDSDEEFRNWLEEHHRHEGRLAVLTASSTLSIEEELEEKELKKRKLFLKDQMASRVRAFTNSRPVHA